ncbi:MAG: RimK/LysX family protein [Candidatus Woesearchaeota archaeon]
MTEKIIIGLVEKVTVHGEEDEKSVKARIDTGAAYSSIDTHLAAELRLGPIQEVKVIKSANGRRARPAIRTTITLADKKCEGVFTLADRGHMKFDVLIGRDVLEQGFLIDPNK